MPPRVEPETITGAAQFVPAAKISEVVEQAKARRRGRRPDRLGADIVGCATSTLYGLKGVCAYAHHAHALGYRTDETDAGIENGLAFLGAESDRRRRAAGARPRTGQRQLPGDGDARRRQHRQLR